MRGWLWTSDTSCARSPLTRLGVLAGKDFALLVLQQQQCGSCKTQHMGMRSAA